MIKTGDSVILKFSPITREIKRYDGKVYAYESMENAMKFLRPGEKDAILMEYVPAPVRCHECKHCDWAGGHPYCLLHECYMDENGFCSLGEREADMAKKDVRECRDCRHFELDTDDGGICFSCKKGEYSKIHFFVDACPKFEEEKEA